MSGPPSLQKGARCTSIRAAGIRAGGIGAAGIGAAGIPGGIYGQGARGSMWAATKGGQHMWPE